MATSTSARIDQIDAAIDALLAAMASTSGAEEYQLPSGVRVRRSAFGTTVETLQRVRDRLAVSLARSAGGGRRVRVGSMSRTTGIDR